jgi:hypothetical protein
MSSISQQEQFKVKDVKEIKEWAYTKNIKSEGS